MSTRRTQRLNSLLQEVLSEVIRKDVNNPLVSEFTTIMQVDISKDLRHAKVYISVIGTDKEKEETIKALRSAAGFISVLASKKVVLRFFPSLTFVLDTTVDKQIKIDSLLKKIHEKNESNPPHES